jgi:ATP-binding cassette, subfamily D (ALD), peroxisomal long-chain fatty acid import protein
MPLLSTLRQNSQPALASFAKAYSAHRPLVQRILTAGFIINVLVTTFGGLSTRSAPPSTSKGEASEQSKASETGRPPRVAVRLNHTSQT